jgi:deazaflavin-dependent oxidoreductase (nitroreductase family)
VYLRAAPGQALVGDLEVTTEFAAPTTAERLFNKVFGVLVGLGLGPRDYYLLQVRGRTTGRVRSTPVNVVEVDGHRFLVAPRGRTQWVRNAEAAGTVALKVGRRRRTYRLGPLADADKPEVLRAYLDRFRTFVQRYFPVPAGSPPAAFVALAARYPVFELF